jgi:hypothetical protein
MNYILKKTKWLVIVLVLSFIVASCSLTTPINATGYTVGSKVGTATATGYLGMFFNGDASIRTAAKNGGINRISSVDIKKTNIAFIIMTYETIVTGE